VSSLLRAAGRFARRSLRAVTDVRSEEVPLALSLTLNVFLLLTAYYVIKPVREALILSLDSGAEYKSYMSAAIAVALLGAVPAYARLVDRLPRLQLVVGVTLFFASHLVVFYAVSRVEAWRGVVGLGFYVWIGVFNMMVVAQLWAFANDLYDPERGKRLFPLVALGASLGAALGSKVAAVLVGLIGVDAMLLVSSGLLVACAALFVVSERLSLRTPRSAVPAPSAVVAPSAAPAVEEAEPRGAFQLVFRHRYVALIALFTLVFNFANSNGEYILGKLVKAEALEAVAKGLLAPADVRAFVGRAYADFYFTVNVVGVLVQAFLVSRVLRTVGLTGALLVLPLLTLGSSVAVLFAPVLAVFRVGKTLENATDYSLNNTVRQMLWLPTSAALKYKAKQAVDTFFVRLGDVSSALLVYVGAELLGWSVRGFAVVNAILALVWTGLAIAIVLEQRRFARVPSPPASGPRNGDENRLPWRGRGRRSLAA
jgi:ATP:ADP antiporter, AAA family